jgi:hypothetical protein
LRQLLVITAVALAILAALSGTRVVNAVSCTYDGGPGGSWHDAGNWDCGQVPGAGDTASIGAGADLVGDLVNVTADASVGTVLLGDGGRITFSGGATLTAGTFTAGISKLEGTGTLTVSGTFTKSGASDGHILEIRDSADLVLNGLAVQQGGDICVATINGNGDSTLQINNTFTIEATAGPAPFTCSRTDAAIHIGPAGHVIKTGAGEKRSWTPIDNDGTLTVEEGSFLLTGGSSVPGGSAGETSDGEYLADEGATLVFEDGRPPLIGRRLGGEGTIHINALSPVEMLDGATLDPAILQITSSTLRLNGASPAIDLPVFNLSGVLNSNRPVTVHEMNVTGGAIQNDFTLTVASDGSFSKTTAGTFSVNNVFVGGAADLVLNADATLDDGTICVARTDDGDPDLPNLQINKNFTIGAGAPATALNCSASKPHVNGPDGHLLWAGSGTMRFDGALDVAGGTVTIGEGQTFQVVNGIALSGGGVLEGSGQVTGNVTNTSGIVSPGASPGTLTITGNYTQGAGATLEVDVDSAVQGTGYDHLAVGGSATLDGSVAVVQGAGFDPQETDVFQILTSASRSGTFSTLTGETLPSGKTYSLDYPDAPDFGARLVVSAASPANDNNPRIIGTTSPGTVLVRIYETADCSGPAVEGTAADFESTGLPVSVADNSTTTFYATAVDQAAFVSDCSTSSITYVEDSPDADADGDGVADAVDNCPADANADQADNDGDGLGDICDADDDKDGIPDAQDDDDNGDGVPDVCEPFGPFNVITGNGGNNFLNGTNGNDLIDGREGHDLINGRGGNDCIIGGDGNDLIFAGDGNDVVYGGDDADALVGGSGNDTLDGGAGNDALFGLTGNDNVTGGAGNDVANGGGGTDDCDAEAEYACET